MNLTTTISAMSLNNSVTGGCFVIRLFQFVLFILELRCSCAYPGGAPDGACSSIFPSGHSASAQTSDPPYRIHIPRTTYKPGETISVTIYGEKTYFKGLLVQARRFGCHANTSETIGVFTVTDPLLQTRHCFGIVHSTVSHTSNALKDSVSFHWTAPVVPSGHFIIRATVVKDLTTFWTNVDSAPLVDLHSDDMLTCDGSHLAGHARKDSSATRSPLLNSKHRHVGYDVGTGTGKSDNSGTTCPLANNIKLTCSLFIIVFTLRANFHLLFNN